MLQKDRKSKGTDLINLIGMFRLSECLLAKNYFHLRLHKTIIFSFLIFQPLFCSLMVLEGVLKALKAIVVGNELHTSW